MADAVWHGRPGFLADLIRDLPLYLTGTKLDPTSTGVIERMRIRMGKAALNVIHREYIVKSVGHKDLSGIEWADLSPVTIRKRTQRKLAVKARTKRDKTNESVEVEILIDTGRLLRSFDSMSGSEDQVFETTPTGVRAGSVLDYAEKHQKGGESESGAPVPMRKIIPDWDDWPPEWKQEVLREMNWGATELLKEMCNRSQYQQNQYEYA